MRKKWQLDITDHRVWNDKKIKPEAKEIFAYLYANGFNKIIAHLNIGDLQQLTRIKNKGLRKILKLLQDNNYIRFKEYHNGMYEYSIY